jgi:hypothetical protein
MPLSADRNYAAAHLLAGFASTGACGRVASPELVSDLG